MSIPQLKFIVHLLRGRLAQSPKITLSLGHLATQHLVLRLHCNLAACQQVAHVTCRIYRNKAE